MKLVVLFSLEQLTTQSYRILKIIYLRQVSVCIGCNFIWDKLVYFQVVTNGWYSIAQMCTRQSRRAFLVDVMSQSELSTFNFVICFLKLSKLSKREKKFCLPDLGQLFWTSRGLHKQLPPVKKIKLKRNWLKKRRVEICFSNLILHPPQPQRAISSRYASIESHRWFVG